MEATPDKGQKAEKGALQKQILTYALRVTKTQLYVFNGIHMHSELKHGGAKLDDEHHATVKENKKGTAHELRE